MILTIEQLVKSMPACNKAKAASYLEGFNQTIQTCELNTPLRLAHFLAQVGHESASLLYSEEIASGKAYEGRKDLGNTVVGDGVRFKGRGLIQITGRANYKAYGQAVGIDFITNPKLLGQPPHSVNSAGWFWKSRALNLLADADDIIKVTKKINGGTNGLDDRKKRLAICKAVLHQA